MIDSIADRIKEIAQTFHGNEKVYGMQSKMARKIGCSQGLVRDWIAGKAAPKDNYRRVICEAYGISRDWLDTGIGEMLAGKALDSGKTAGGTETALIAPPQPTELLEARTEARIWKAAFERLSADVGARVSRVVELAEKDRL